MSQKVILISGNLKSGKSTISKMLVKKFAEASQPIGGMRPAPPRIFSFASSIKRIARDEFGWDGKKDEKGRRLLQTLGTEVGRMYDPDVWVNKFSDFLRDECGENEVVIVDDWRFENEYNKIKFPDCGGSIYKVRVRRDNNDNMLKKVWQYLKSLFIKKHASETGLPEDKSYYDFNFSNNYKSLDDLKDSKEFRRLYNKIYFFINNN